MNETTETSISVEKKHLEALLFVAKEPLTLKDIKHRLSNDDSLSEDIILRWLFELKIDYENRGFRIRQIAGGFEMVSAPECHDVIEKIIPKHYEKLSTAQNEILGIIAYNQGIKKGKIAKIRGVKNCDEALQRLVEKGLVVENEDESGKTYSTTDKFLTYLGINDLKELPPLPSAEEVDIEITEKEEGDKNE